MSITVVERNDLRQGEVYQIGSFMVVGTMQATPVQRLVMEGVAAAHPWFRCRRCHRTDPWPGPPFC